MTAVCDERGPLLHPLVQLTWRATAPKLVSTGARGSTPSHESKPRIQGINTNSGPNFQKNEAGNSRNWKGVDLGSLDLRLRHLFPERSLNSP